MSKILRYIVFMLLPIFALSCAKPGNNGSKEVFTLNRSDIIGCWKVVQAKYDESATMTEWTYEDTYAIFLENGQYHGEGHFGTGDGTYSISGNTITAKIDNEPYIVYDVTDVKGEKAEMIATIQSNKMKIWMVCERFYGGDEYLEQPPVETLNPEDIFSTESQVFMFVSGVYSELLIFAALEQSIENKLVSRQLAVLNPANAEIMSLWTRAYKILRMVNSGIDVLDGMDTSFSFKYLSHLKVLRAFMAYNIATLWGEAPFYTSVPDSTNDLTFYNADALLAAALRDMESLVDWDLNNVPEYMYLNATALRVLIGEIQLTLGNNQEAKNSLSVSWDADIFHRGDMVFCLSGQQQSEAVLVYSKDRILWLQKEADGKTGEAMEGWSAEGGYGYWRMLKRIGKAKEVCACEDYQLLLPIPEAEAIKIGHQNPGY